jgi:hypothetical protein
VGLEDFLACTALLEALRLGTREASIRVVCPQDLVPLLAGFDLRTIDRERYLKDDQYMETEGAAARDYAPDLLVNLDRHRRITGDLLAEAANAPGSLGFDDETPENRNDPVRVRRSKIYKRLMPRDAPCQALAAALGIQSGAERLWLDSASLAKATGVLEASGWNLGRTLAVLADDPDALTGSGARKVEQAMRDGWTAIGLGGPGTQPILHRTLAPFGARARNLGGTLPLADMAALLHLCGAFTAGSPLFQALARAAGSTPFAPGQS